MILNTKKNLLRDRESGKSPSKLKGLNLNLHSQLTIIYHQSSTPDHHEQKLSVLNLLRLSHPSTLILTIYPFQIEKNSY